MGIFEKNYRNNKEKTVSTVSRRGEKAGKRWYCLVFCGNSRGGVLCRGWLGRLQNVTFLKHTKKGSARGIIYSLSTCHYVNVWDNDGEKNFPKAKKGVDGVRRRYQRCLSGSLESGAA